MDKKAAGIIAIGLVVASFILVLVPMVSSLSLTRPVAAGGLVSVQVWKNPVGASSNEGSTYTEGRLEVYDRFILVVHPKGERTLHLHGSYTNLRFKSD